MAKWYLARPYASPFGPVAEDELRSRIRQGTLAADSLVWTRGMGQWTAVRNVAALADDLQNARPGQKPAPEAEAKRRPESVHAPDKPTLNGPVGGASVAAKSASPRPDRAPDSGGTVVIPDAPKRPEPVKSHEATGPATTRLPPPGNPLTPSTTADTQVGRKAPDPSVLAATVETKRSGPPRVVLIGGALVVVLLLVIVAASAKSRGGPVEESALYSPCIKQTIVHVSDVAGKQELVCGEAKLMTRTEGTSLVVGLAGAAGNGMAARTPELVASVQPNLPKTPSMARTLEVRQVMRLDLRGIADSAQRTRAALKTYADAEKYLEAYQLMGGHRFARWLLDEGRLEVENKLLPEGPEVVLQFFPGEGAPGALTDADRGLNTPEVSWTAPWTPQTDPPYLTELRKVLMADGWWYDDAEAFLNAAAVDGIEKTSAAASAIRLIAQWLRTSDQWDPRTRHSVWTDCFAPRINGSASGVARERFDQLAGAKDVEPFANPPDYHNPDEQITVEGFTFNASIGSATHAYCAIAMGDPLIDVPQETAANRVLRRGPPGARSVAERLIKSPKFLAAIGEELTKARAQLLKPGAPEL